MLKFRPINIADKKFFELAASENPVESCEQTFAVNYVYSENYKTQIALWNNRIAVLKPKHGILHYPIGKPANLDELVSYVREADESGIKFDYLYDVPPNYSEKFPAVRDFFDIVENDGDFDYIYSLESLKNMKGPLLRKKRNHIKHFEKQNPNWTCEEISPLNIDQAADFALENAADFEKGALSKAFQEFDAIGLGGLILRSDSHRIVGFAAFARMPCETFDVIFEKSDKSFDGSAQMLVRLEAETLSSKGAIFMNREQDFGEQNLRQAKRSLDPVRMYKRLSLVPRFL